MKTTKRKMRGHNAWEVLIDGKVVGEVFKQGTADGLFLPFRPAVATGKVDPDEGPIMRVLQAQSTLDGAVEAVRLAATSAAAKVNDRVTFIGVGMTADRAAKFANAMAKKIAEEARS